MDIVFLGTSSEKAIPRKGCQCSQCKSDDFHDKRRRSALLIDLSRRAKEDKKILLDAGPDILAEFKSQKVKVKKIVAVIITHEHPDHIGGLPDLLKANPTLQVFKPKEQKLELEGYKIKTIVVPHKFAKKSTVLTTTIIVNDKLLYAPDFSDIRPLLPYLEKVKVAVLDGSMWERDFGGHQAMKKQIELIKSEDIKTEVYFTHDGHTHIPHKNLEAEIKKIGGQNFHLAYDGLKLKI